MQKVQLMENDEHTILSRIRYPDVDSANLVPPDDTVDAASKTTFSSDFQLSEQQRETTTRLTPTRKKLIIGIASMARPQGHTANYLLATLNSLFNALKNYKKQVGNKSRKFHWVYSFGSLMLQPVDIVCSVERC